MTCSGYLIEFAGNQICIPIYREEVKWPPHPDPDPRTRVFDDIRVLATINEGISHISDRHVRENLTQAVQVAAKAISLPNGVKLGDGLFKVHATAAE
jgi:hypothetical protein